MAIREHDKKSKEVWKREFWVGFLAGLILIGGVALILLAIFFF